MTVKTSTEYVVEPDTSRDVFHLNNQERSIRKRRTYLAGELLAR